MVNLYVHIVIHIITLSSLVFIVGEQVWIQLMEIPLASSILCPYQPLTMSCKHTPTRNQPDWTVTMNGREIFRGIDFHLGSLDHHRIVNDTVEEEVLTINRLLPKFSGQQYSCQYDTVNGPVTSGNINLKIEG